MDRINILIIGRKMHKNGGLQKYIIDLLRHIDKEEFSVDILIPCKDKSGQDYVSEIEEMGSEIYYVEHHSSSIYRHFSGIYNCLKKLSKNTIIHIHTTSSIEALDGLFVYLLGFKNIIYHSHNTSIKKKWYKKIIEMIYRLTGKYFLACSKHAGESLFGQSVSNQINFYVANNGIDTNRFKFSSNIRELIREELGLKDKDKAIGFVGRFEKQKNPMFLVSAFKSYYEINKDAKLILIGAGSLYENIKEFDVENFPRGTIIYLGIRDNVSDYMQAMDLLLLPSLYEGLGIVLIEAQCNGLGCIVSNAIPDEAKITDHIFTVNLNQGVEVWAKEIDFYLNRNVIRKDFSEVIKKKGFDISISIKAIEGIYRKLL